MDFKRIITLFLAIVMCVNLLASAFPTVAYASGGAIQVEASDMSEAKASDDVVMEISGEAKDTGQALEEEKTAEGIGENASVADEEQKTEDDSEKETETETAAPVEETEKETLIDSGSGDIVVSEDTVKQEEATELQETEEEKVVRLKEMVEAFPEEAGCGGWTKTSLRCFMILFPRSAICTNRWMQNCRSRWICVSWRLQELFLQAMLTLSLLRIRAIFTVFRRNMEQESFIRDGKALRYTALAG